MLNYTYKKFARSLPWVALAAALVPGARAADLESGLKAVDSKVIDWRRDLHQHPELSNREVRTAKLVADHLRKLCLSVETGIARTGVVGLLKSGQPGQIDRSDPHRDCAPAAIGFFYGLVMRADERACCGDSARDKRSILPVT